MSIFRANSGVVKATFDAGSEGLIPVPLDLIAPSWVRKWAEVVFFGGTVEAMPAVL